MTNSQGNEASAWPSRAYNTMTARRDPPCLRAAVQALGKVASMADHVLAIIAQQPRHHCAEDKAAEVDVLHSARGGAQADEAGRHKACSGEGRSPFVQGQASCRLCLQSITFRLQPSVAARALQRSHCFSLMPILAFQHSVPWHSGRARHEDGQTGLHLLRHACLAYGLPMRLFGCVHTLDTLAKIARSCTYAQKRSSRQLGHRGGLLIN